MPKGIARLTLLIACKALFKNDFSVLCGNRMVTRGAASIAAKLSAAE